MRTMGQAVEWRIGLLAAATLLAVASPGRAQPPPRLDVPAVVPLEPVRPLPPEPARPREAPRGDIQGSFGPPPAGQAAAGCAPAGLVRMIIRNVTPSLSAAAPQAQPRTLYRLGKAYLRSEEPPDPTRGGLSPLIIVSEPDVWTINQSDRTGRHSIDPGPVLEVRAPILPPDASLPPVFRSLEFGCEAEFVAAHAPQAQQTIPWGPTKAGMHVLTSGEHVLAFVMDARRSSPMMISYSRGGRPLFAIRYDAYRAGVEGREDLFSLPKNVRITEAPTTAAAPAR